jgi:glycine cleavage system H protein
MPDDRTFLMGKYPALLPGGLRYARNHMWCRVEGGRLRFGFSSYAVRLMQDVYFLDWSLAAPTAVSSGQQIGHIETSKAVSDLFAPLAGVITEFNAELLNDPSAINADTHGGGWLFDMEGDTATLLSADEYHEYLIAAWEKAQRTLKGQVNQE